MKYIFYLSIFVVFFSCRKKELPIPIEPNVNVYICNEGQFGNGFGHISSYNSQTNEVNYNPFYDKNGSNGGNLLQSAYIINNDMWLLYAGSNKILIVDPKTFEYKTQIDGISSPNYLAQTETFVYVTSQFSNKVFKINKTDKTSTTINLPYSFSNDIISKNNKVYIACWDSACQQIIVYNETTNSLDAPISLNGYAAPSKLASDGTDLFVLSGNSYLGKISAVHKISNFINTTSQPLPINGEFTHIQQNGNNIYLNSTTYTFAIGDLNGVYKLPKSTLILDTQRYITPPSNATFYGFYINPTDGSMYCSNAKTYIVDGDMLRYSNSGTFIQSFKVGIAPNFVCFPN